jgi:hypothetical protein
MTQQRLVVLFCGLLTISPLIQAHRDHRDHEPDTTGLQAVGIGITAGVLAGGLFAWLSSPSTKDIHNDAKDALQAGRAYASLIEYLEHAIGVTPLARLSGTESYDLIHNPTESSLLDIAQLIYASEQAATTYSANLSKTIDKLLSMSKQLARRIRKIGHYHKHYDDLIATQHQLDQLVASLETALRYLKKHISYMTLFEHETTVLHRYKRELNLLADHDAALTATSLRELYGIVLHYAKQINSPYPFIAYADRMYNDKRLLETKLHDAFTYDTRTTACRALYNQLETLYNYIITNPEYSRDLRNREQDRIEQERQRLEQERLRLERERIALQNQQLAQAATNLLCGCLSLSGCCHHYHKPTHVVVQHEYIAPAPTYTVVETHYVTPPSSYTVTEREYYEIEEED